MQPPRLAYAVAITAAFACASLSFGCMKKSAQKLDSVNSNETQQVSRQKDSPDIQAEIGSFDAVLPDDKGRPWVAISGVASAKLLTDSSGNKNASSTIKGTKALIYQNGKPTFTLSAPLIVADQKTARVTASGRVIAASADGALGPSRKLVSDTMIWDMKRTILVGKGGTRLYDSTGFDIPAGAFKADATLGQITVFTDEKPVTGWWK